MKKSEIVLTEINNIVQEVDSLNESNWIKITNKHLDDVNIIICKTKCEAFRGVNMLLNDCVTIHFENVDFIYKSRIIPLNMLKYYIALLLNEKDKKNIFYISILMLHQLKIGDTIVFTNDKLGIILPPKNEYIGTLHYKLIKKDGNLGAKELNLYGNSKYKVLGREFIDYEKILKI